MSKAVITVKANKGQFTISFDEKALAELGSDKADDLFRGLNRHISTYLDHVNSKTKYRHAKDNWIAIRQKPEEYVDIPF